LQVFIRYIMQTINSKTKITKEKGGVTTLDSFQVVDVLLKWIKSLNLCYVKESTPLQA
jgi:hypothetical protein